MTALTTGDTAPDFCLPDADGETVCLADFRDQKVVLYFYPAAMTPGCSIEAEDFSSHLDAFAGAGYQVLGISPDDQTRLGKFRERKNLTVRLLADPDREVIGAYGVWGTKMLYGKAIEGVIRTTFVIAVDDRGSGTIERVYAQVRARGHVDTLLRELLPSSGTDSATRAE